MAVRLGRRVTPAPAPKVLRGYDGEVVKPGRVLTRIVANSLYDRDRNQYFSRGDVVDFDEPTVKDLLRQKAVERVAP